MRLSGANPSTHMTALDPLPGKSNYLIGNNRSKWRVNVPQFARVRYENVYPGINLVFYGNQGQLEYDFQVAPGADPGNAELEFRGAKQLDLQEGALVISTGERSVKLEAPRVYQEIAGEKHFVEGKFVLQYAGNMGRTHGLESLLEAATRLRERDDIVFLFIGSGGKREWQDAAVHREDSPRAALVRPECDAATTS